MSSSYLRFPHLRGSLLTFVAEDDVWLAPAEGGRAYRLSADQVPVANPRLTDDGTRVAWTSWRDQAPEVHVADTEGGLATRLTYWGNHCTRTIGWTDSDDVVALSAADQPFSRWTWAYAVPGNGGPARRLPYGPVSNIVLGPGGCVLLTSVSSREPAWWKRYRGGTTGKLWWDAAGDGEFAQLLAELNGNIESPMLLGDGPSRRVAFISDHEGWGNVYSVGAGSGTDVSGTDLRRHTDHGVEGGDQPPFYARHATTDGTRIVYECAGQLWLLDALDQPARRLDVRLGGPRSARAPYQASAARYLASAIPDKTGRLSIVEVRGTVHRLVHRDGPARVLAATDGARARLARPLGSDFVVWVSDATGEDAVYIAPLSDAPEGAGTGSPDSDATANVVPTPEVYGHDEIGRVLELAAAPDGSKVAVACHDGRLLVLDGASGTFTELAVGADGEVSGLAFSPDSTWLAWSDPAEPGLRRILIADVTEQVTVPIAVTEPRFVDTNPV